LFLYKNTQKLPKRQPAKKTKPTTVFSWVVGFCFICGNSSGLLN